MHVRALSFSSLGKAALRGLRLPVFAGTAALGTAAGTLAMANRTADSECGGDGGGERGCETCH